MNNGSTWSLRWVVPGLLNRTKFVIFDPFYMYCATKSLWLVVRYVPHYGLSSLCLFTSDVDGREWRTCPKGPITRPSVTSETLVLSPLKSPQFHRSYTSRLLVSLLPTSLSHDLYTSSKGFRNRLMTSHVHTLLWAPILFLVTFSRSP